MPPVTRALLYACVAVYLLQANVPLMLDWLALWPPGSRFFAQYYLASVVVAALERAVRTILKVKLLLTKNNTRSRFYDSLYA